MYSLVIENSIENGNGTSLESLKTAVIKVTLAA